jgi:hypothetical protein
VILKRLRGLACVIECLLRWRGVFVGIWSKGLRVPRSSGVSSMDGDREKGEHGENKE